MSAKETLSFIKGWLSNYRLTLGIRKQAEPFNKPTFAALHEIKNTKKG